MTVFNYGQLERLWINAGGPKTVAPIMAAIAMAESGGNSASNNYTDNNGTQTSWGLWQISNGTHNWPGPNDPNNPANNAAYAVAKYNGDRARGNNGFQPWGTYTSGLYRQYLQGSVPPDSSVPGGPTGEHSGPGSPGGITGIAVQKGINPPYKVGQLHSPLTATQRIQITSWLTAVKEIPLNLLNESGSKQDDQLLITEYEAVLKGGGVAKAPTSEVWTPAQALRGIFGSLNDFFNFLKNVIGLIIQPSFWLRVLSGLGGIIALGIAGYMIATAS